MVTHSIEVNRPAAAFAFLEQFERHAEWQPSLVSAHIEPPGRFVSAPGSSNVAKHPWANGT
jgi:Polyketide cyclase / dehydrase and lipid transport.